MIMHTSRLKFLKEIFNCVFRIVKSCKNLYLQPNLDLALHILKDYCPSAPCYSRCTPLNSIVCIDNCNCGSETTPTTIVWDPVHLLSTFYMQFPQPCKTNYNCTSAKLLPDCPASPQITQGPFPPVVFIIPVTVNYRPKYQYRDTIQRNVNNLLKIRTKYLWMALFKLRSLSSKTVILNNFLWKSGFYAFKWITFSLVNCVLPSMTVLTNPGPLAVRAPLLRVKVMNVYPLMFRLLNCLILFIVSNFVCNVVFFKKTIGSSYTFSQHVHGHTGSGFHSGYEYSRGGHDWLFLTIKFLTVLYWWSTLLL